MGSVESLPAVFKFSDSVILITSEEEAGLHWFRGEWPALDRALNLKKTGRRAHVPA